MFDVVTIFLEGCKLGGSQCRVDVFRALLYTFWDMKVIVLR